MMNVALFLALLAAAPVAFAARPACEGVSTLMDKGANGDGFCTAWCTTLRSWRIMGIDEGDKMSQMYLKWLDQFAPMRE